MNAFRYSSFDICEDTGGAAAFFPSGKFYAAISPNLTVTMILINHYLGHGALTGTYSEVSCSEWSGSDGSSEFTGACLSGQTAGFWPSVGCGNKGEFRIISNFQRDAKILRRYGTFLSDEMMKKH